MITNVTEGVFILSKAIDNPKPDRRYKNQWLCASQWTPGARFAIRRARYFERYTEKRANEKIEAYELTSLDDGHSSSVMIYRDTSGAWATTGGYSEETGPALLSLIENLVPSKDPEDPLLFVLLSHGGGGGVRREASSVLFRLFVEGAVTLAQVQAALAAEDAEFAAEEAREAAEREAKKSSQAT